MKYKLLASAPDLGGIIKMIERFWPGAKIGLIGLSDHYEVASSIHVTPIVSGFRVIKKGKRFRFECEMKE